MTPARSPSPKTADAPARQDAPEAILDAAEEVFADNGFHGASTRAIATRAQVNSALIHYYFGSKEALFESVIARRSGAINDARRATLSQLHAAATPPSLEQVLDALLRPTVELGRDPARGGVAYTRLLAQTAASTDERSRRLTGRHYNDIALIFIDEIQAAEPALSRADAVHAYLNTIAIGISLMAPTGRATTLGASDTDDLDRLIARSVRFIAAGIRSLLADD